jgi:hypothetical protein
MLNQNFTFAEGYTIVADEELANVQGGHGWQYNVGHALGDLWDGFKEGITSWI